MHKLFNQTFESLHQLKQLLKSRLATGRNLVYISSGTRIREGYNELPFNVVLVDKAIKKLFSEKGNVITIGLTPETLKINGAHRKALRVGKKYYKLFL